MLSVHGNQTYKLWYHMELSSALPHTSEPHGVVTETPATRDGDQLYSAGNDGDWFGVWGGNVTMSGLNSTGNDVFFGAAGTGTLTFIAGSGNDLFGLGQGTNNVTLGPGNSTVFANTGNTATSTIVAGSGSASIVFGGKSVDLDATLFG